MHTFEVFVVNDFSKIIVCLHGQGQREIETVRAFCGQGGREYKLGDLYIRL